MIPIPPSILPIIGVIVFVGILAVIGLAIAGIVLFSKSKKNAHQNTEGNKVVKQNTHTDKKTKLHSKVKTNFSVHESPLSKAICDTKMSVGKLMAQREQMIVNNASNVEISRIDALIEVKMYECDKFIVDSQISVYPKDFQTLKDNVEKYYKDTRIPRTLKTEGSGDYKKNIDTEASQASTIKTVDVGTNPFEEKLKLEAAEAAINATAASKKEYDEKTEKEIIDELYPDL